MSQLEFDAILVRPEATGSWTYVNIPADVSARFGTKRQVPIKGTVNGVPLQGSLMPHGDGTFYLVIKQAIRDAAGVTQGDSVQISLEPDDAPRRNEVPEDLQQALQGQSEAGAVFEKLAYSHQKAYLDWIGEAKKPETRARRIEKALVLLSEGKKLK
ncbi:DUF1905 domain-containing protein [bacterium]|nr:DUF1905 domain-containing protein [bacterium]